MTDPDQTLPADAATEPHSTTSPARQGRVVLRPGVQVGRYILDREVGRGAMGRVYAAHDPDLDRRVALKIVVAETEQRRERALDEARAMAQLNHENVITVYDVGVADSFVFIAMELVSGDTLHTVQDDRPGWKPIVQAYCAAAFGLAAAHEAGLVHGDFKADNVLVDNGRILVSDFGLAAALARPDDQTDPARRGPAGTPAYMAPEVIDGRAPQPASDQFSFCVSLYEALYGYRPFEGSTLPQLATSIAAQRLPLISPTPRIPSSVHAVLLRGLRVDPEKRWPTMHQLRAALARPLRGRRQWATVGLSGAVMVSAAMLAWPEPPTEGCEGRGDPLGGIYDAAARSDMRTRIERDGIAPEQSARIEDRLDRWTGTWRQTHRTLCEAGGSGDSMELDAGMQCLITRRATLRSTLEILRSPDSGAAEHASEVIAKLDDPAICLEGPKDAATTVPTRAQTRSPRFAAASQRVVILLTMRDVDRALRAARNLLSDHGPDDDPLLHAEALKLYGRSLSLAGRRAEAASTFERAFTLARASGNDADAAFLAVELAYVATKRSAREDAQAWLEHARALLPRVPSSWRSELQIALLETEADVSVDAGDYAAAKRALDQALAIARRDEPDAEPPLALLHGYAVALRESGALDPAMEAAQQGLQLCSARFGSDNAACLGFVNQTALIALQRRELDLAEELLRKALATVTNSLGPDHPEFVVALNNLANAVKARGDYETAQDLLSRAAALVEKTHGRNHRHYVAVSVNLAEVQLHAGRAELAVETLERARTWAEAALGPRDPVAARVLRVTAHAALEVGDDERALALGHEALAADKAILSPEHPNHSRSLTVIGTAYLKLGEPAQALLALRQAYELAGDEKDGRIGLITNLTEALVRTGHDGPEVDALLREAVDELEQAQYYVSSSDLDNLARVRALRQER